MGMSGHLKLGKEQYLFIIVLTCMHKYIHAIYMRMVCLLKLFLRSAGVGRTGTFIAVDAMMQRLKERDDLDICTFVTQMRTKRTYMVQNLVSIYVAIWRDCIWAATESV